MLNRLVHLLPEVTQFLEERNKGDLKAAISDEAFQCRLALLADMFSHLNELNRKLQGADSDIIGHRDKVNAFVSKLELWRGKFETGRSATAFPTLARITDCWWRQRRSQERSHHPPQQAAGRVSALFSGLQKQQPNDGVHEGSLQLSS
ncbi:protein FAM200C-like [Macrobrachium rosenbergii]|uniref:protein FAM200C-like n=1 Tax=Macrobrachium rosenbergii TaxID=79674 RepID=UPI0034D40BE0